MRKRAEYASLRKHKKQPLVGTPFSQFFLVLTSVSLVSCGDKGGGYIPPSPVGPPPEPEEPKVVLRIEEWTAGKSLETGV